MLANLKLCQLKVERKKWANTLSNGVFIYTCHLSSTKNRLNLPYITLLHQDRLWLGSKNESFGTFILYFARLALLCFAKIGCGSEVKMKVFGLSFCTSLALHYFANANRLHLDNKNESLLVFHFVLCSVCTIFAL